MEWRYTRCYAGAMLRACDMLVRCHGFMKKVKKNIYGEKPLQSTMFFFKKKYKAKFLISLILKK
jgi:hypothetical protein